MGMSVFYLDEPCEVPAYAQDCMANAVNQRVYLGVQVRGKPIQKINDPFAKLRAALLWFQIRGLPRALARRRGVARVLAR